MTQTLAIFHDAYRSLNAKKMFWAVLVISGLVVAAFAALGINDRGLKILVWQFDTEPVTTQTVPAAMFYKYLFVSIGIGVWLTWLATILALISTAGIFPDLVNGGSIGLLVSKPIGRLRLFLTEYLGGLLFVTLQVAVFCLASFLVIGLRGGAWEPGLFLAVPVVACFFSYLFAVCALIGIATRSTLVSLLLTLVFWFLVYGVGTAENTLLMFKTMDEKGVLREQMAAGPHESPPAAIHPPNRETPLTSAESGPPEEHEADYRLAVAHQILYAVKTVLPKTTETIGLLERNLIDLSDLPDGALGQPPRKSRQGQATWEVAETLRGRSVWWIVGTSLGFEAVVLALAAWIFCRRDF